MGAGHPRLSFELENFTTVEPGHYKIDPDSEKRQLRWDRDNVWAVGTYNSNADGGVVTLIEQWNGGSWSVVPSPNAGSYPISNLLQGVAVVSTNEVWAVGYAGNLSNVPTVKTLIEQWNGTSWSIVTSPSPGAGENRLYGAAVLASTVWAVGTFGTTGNVDNRTLTETYP
jgi:hypothetical protein